MKLNENNGEVFYYLFCIEFPNLYLYLKIINHNIDHL